MAKKEVTGRKAAKSAAGSAFTQRPNRRKNKDADNWVNLTAGTSAALARKT